MYIILYIYTYILLYFSKKPARAWFPPRFPRNVISSAYDVLMFGPCLF